MVSTGSRRSSTDSAPHRNEGAGLALARQVHRLILFARRFRLLPLAPEFLSLYPEIELDISLTDGVISLIEERTDIAIRSGAMGDSSLKARKLKEVRRVIVASPA